MELDKIELLIEKYFEGETNIAEENIIRDYFLSNDVPENLEPYKAIFGYFSDAKKEKAANESVIIRKRSFRWISVAASAAILLTVGTFAYFNTEKYNKSLGTFSDPEIAFQQTQDALNLLSLKVNQGVESLEYIEEYDNAKNRIFNLDY